MAERCNHAMYHADCPYCEREWKEEGRKELAEFEAKLGEPAAPAAPDLREAFALECEHHAEDIRKLARAEQELATLREMCRNISAICKGNEADPRFKQIKTWCDRAAGEPAAPASLQPLTLHLDTDGHLWARLHDEGKDDTVVEVTPDSPIHRFLVAASRLWNRERQP